MDAAKLRPLGVGEVLDAGIKVYRARFGALLKATTIVIAPVYVLFGLVQLSLPDDDELTSDFGSDFGSSDFGGTVETSTEEVWAFVVGALLTTALMFLATQFASAVAVRIVAAAYLGEEATWRDALRDMWSRGWTIVWLTVLYGLFVVGGGIVLVVFFAIGFMPLAVAAAVLAVPLAVYLYGAWMVTVPVLMTEGVGAWKSLGRSRRLVRKRWWPVFVAVMLASILAQILVSTATVALLAVTAIGDSDLVLDVASIVLSTAGAAITTPFIAAIVVVVYFDLRVRKEGFDLELLARSVGVAPEDGGRWSAHAALPMPEPSAVDDPSKPPFWPPPPGWRPPDA